MKTLAILFLGVFLASSCFGELKAPEKIEPKQTPEVAKETIGKQDVEAVEIAIYGPPEAVYFQPKEIHLKLNHRYVLKVANPYSQDYVLAFDNLNESVLTHFVIGSHRMDQLGIGLPAEKTVEWSFTPKKKGKYQFYERRLMGRLNQNVVSTFYFEE